MDKRGLIEYCLTYPDAFEDYPFDENWTVMRHGGNKKSFAFIYERDGRLCINLKCDPFDADFLRQIYRDVTPAYHMNKTHWNTVTLGAGSPCDSDMPDDELRRMIRRSYNLIKPKARAGK